MNIPEEIRICEYQQLFFTEDTELGELYKAMKQYWNTEGNAFDDSLFYNLGRIHGIREERARRKGGAA